MSSNNSYLLPTTERRTAPLLPAAERSLVAADWNGTPAPRPELQRGLQKVLPTVLVATMRIVAKIVFTCIDRAVRVV